MAIWEQNNRVADDKGHALIVKVTHHPYACCIVASRVSYFTLRKEQTSLHYSIQKRSSWSSNNLADLTNSLSTPPGVIPPVSAQGMSKICAVEIFFTLLVLFN